MTRDEARVLADATTDALLKATGMSVDPEIRQVMRNWILCALDQALTPSREEAAMRAVVEAAKRWGKLYSGSEGRPNADTESVASRIELFDALNLHHAVCADVAARKDIHG